MIGCQGGLLQQCAYGAGVNACAGQNCEIRAGLRLKLLKKLNALQTGRSLAGSEDGVDSQSLCLLQQKPLCRR